MARQRLTEEQIAKLIRWREQGRSCATIAKWLGVSTGAVTYQCLRAGVTSPHQVGRKPNAGPPSFVGKDGRTFRRFTADEDRQLIELSNRGLRLEEIGAKLGRARTSVRMRMLLLGQHEELAS